MWSLKLLFLNVTTARFGVHMAMVCFRTVDLSGSNTALLVSHIRCGTVVNCTVPTHTLFETSFLLAGVACEQEKHVKLQEQEKRNLEKEINSFKFEANKQRKLVASLEKDRDRWGCIFLIIYIVNYPGGKIKTNEMGRACGAYGGG